MVEEKSANWDEQDELNRYGIAWPDMSPLRRP
jgi:hypothetical protein